MRYQRRCFLRRAAACRKEGLDSSKQIDRFINAKFPYLATPFRPGGLDRHALPGCSQGTYDLAVLHAWGKGNDAILWQVANQRIEFLGTGEPLLHHGDGPAASLGQRRSCCIAGPRRIKHRRQSFCHVPLLESGGTGKAHQFGQLRIRPTRIAISQHSAESQDGLILAAPAFKSGKGVLEAAQRCRLAPH